MLSLHDNIKYLREALALFDALLAEPRTTEAQWQKLFSDYPYILSRSLPLRIEPRQIQPLGRPGRSEPDFVIYPEITQWGSPRGIIELKTPHMLVLKFPRNGVVSLSDGAQTAVRQAHVYASSFEWPDRLVVLGDEVVKFVIMGLSRTWAAHLQEEFVRSQMAGLFQGIRLFGYDQIFENYRKSVPQRLLLLVPEWSARTRDTCLIIGNQASYLMYDQAQSVASQIVLGLKTRELSGIDVTLIPSTLYLTTVQKVIKDSSIQLGAQNIGSGYGDETSPETLLNIGVKSVILADPTQPRQAGVPGDISWKLRLCLTNGIRPIVVLGESDEVTGSESWKQEIEKAFMRSFADNRGPNIKNTIIAYQPHWAIGTPRKPASPYQIEAATILIQSIIERQFGIGIANEVQIIYGGGVAPENAAILFSETSIAGLLVELNSTEAEPFLDIIQSVSLIRRGFSH